MGTLLLDLLKKLGDYLIYVSPPVVGVIVGGFVVQKYWIRKANESALIEYLTKELDDLVDQTLEYWSLDCGGTGNRPDEIRKEARKLEQKIKAALKNINSILGRYSERYCSKRYCNKVDFTSLMAEVVDACTCGEFEVVKRPPDRDRFLAVVNTTHRVRWHLFDRRV